MYGRNLTSELWRRSFRRSLRLSPGDLGRHGIVRQVFIVTAPTALSLSRRLIGEIVHHAGFARDSGFGISFLARTRYCRRSHGINYDVPEHLEDYVHRIGRADRAQNVGDAFTLMNGKQLPALQAIEHLSAKKFLD
jgi:hypothetical protein